MMTMWVGFNITDKQFKELVKKSRHTEGIVMIDLEDFSDRFEFMGRTFKKKDIIAGKFTHTEGGTK